MKSYTQIFDCMVGKLVPLPSHCSFSGAGFLNLGIIGLDQISL